MFMIIAMVAVPVLVLVFGLVFLQSRYKRCPSNKVLVVYGRVGADKASKCIHGGGTFVLPLIQDFAYLPLEPMSLNIDLKGALSKENIRVHVPSTFTVAVSTDPEVLQNAAQRLLGLKDVQIMEQASEIIFGQFRQAIATMTIDEINQHRDKLLELVNNNVGTELRKVGLEVINVNIRDLSDEAGYIQAIGKRAAAEAVNKASIEVAEQKKIGDIGVANADRDRTIGQAQAGATQRIETANLNAKAVEGENTSKAKIAETNAALKVREAEALRKGEVAQAESQTAILRAQKEKETARLEMEALAKQEVEKKRIQVEAEAEAEKIRITAKAKAEAIWMEKEAEARGIRAILDAKALGYKELINVAKENAPTLLTIEQLPTLVNAQVEAIKGIKIDKVTVWDSGGKDGSTANFINGLVKSLPPLHDVAKNAGLDLPEYLGVLSKEVRATEKANGKNPN